MNSRRTIYFDASAAVKLVVNELGSENVRARFAEHHRHFMTNLCFAEALGVLKSKHTIKSRPDHICGETYLTAVDELRAKAKSEYVIEGGQAEGGSVSYGQLYRCQKVFKKLIDWLRTRGVLARRAIHELRKEAGSIIATQSGIYAASRFLRHADIGITARHYADHKERTAVPLGAMLAPRNVVELPEQGTATA